MVLEDIKRPWLRRTAIVATLILSPIILAVLGAPAIWREIRDVYRDTARDVREIW